MRDLTTPSRLPKIKGWIDANNTGDPLIPFSVSLEEKLAPLEGDERAEAVKEAGSDSGLGKITTAGYASLDVRSIPHAGLYRILMLLRLANSIFHMWT